MNKFISFFVKFLLIILVTIVLLFVTLFLAVKLVCSDISPTAKNLFTTTMLETGQMKFVVSLFLSEEEIKSIVEANSIKEITDELDNSLITTNLDVSTKSETKKDSKGYRIEKISGTTYMGKVLIVDDPSRVAVGTTYPWSEYGKELLQIANDYNAVCAVNGGIYFSDKNKGGRPIGVVVSNHQIQFNSPDGIKGLYLIGLNDNNILQIINITGFSSQKVETLVKEKCIRDAVCFQEEQTDKNNHFVKLIINGEERPFDGMGSGVNPRTAIGQREDGAIIFFVTDGRGRDGHLGATIKDIIKVMKQYGAVNAANLDGGSSSSMVCEGKYEMTSVTLYSSNSSWRLPAAFIVK